MADSRQENAKSQVGEVKAGIVTTLKGAGPTVESWVAYHLHLGFAKLYLYFDDPQDTSIQSALKFDQNKVVVLKHNEKLKNQWKQLMIYESMEPFIESEVQARQQLNAEHAARLALSDGVEWLLHIDSDELFFLRPPLTLAAHFHGLSVASVGNMNYMNYEGVPERESLPDPFLGVTLFRQHLQAVDMTSHAYHAIEFWKARTTHHQYFIAYDCGKSAAQVVPGLMPQGVHKFRIPPTHPHLRSTTAIVDAKSLDLSSVLQCPDALILHYVVCGFEWYLKKYQILDAFPNFWFGGKLKIHPCFHLESRDLYLTGDTARLRQHYRSQVMIADKDQVAAQIEANTCIRIEEPQRIIREELKKLYASDFPPWATPDANLDDNAELELGEAEKSSETKPQPRQAADGPPSVVNTLSLDASWIISNLVAKYLKPPTTTDDQASQLATQK